MRWWRGAVRGGGLLLIAAGMAGLAALAQTSAKDGLDLTFHNGIFRGMAAFAVGAGMAVVHRSMRSIDLHLANVLQVGVIAALVFAIYFGGPRHSVDDVLVAALEMALVFVLAFDRGCGGMGVSLRAADAAGGMVLCDLSGAVPADPGFADASGNITPLPCGRWGNGAAWCNGPKRARFWPPPSGWARF